MEHTKKEKRSKKKGTYLFGLISVMVLWGITPILTKGWFYDYLSPAFSMILTGFFSTFFMGIVCGKKWKKLDRRYLTALVTGFFYSLAVIMQKIGLKETTPGACAFLENLSCLAVPLILWAFTKKRPTALKFFSCFLCLAGSLILNGGFSGRQALTGNLLSAAAGIFYGVNIAGTALFAKKLDAGLYLFVQFAESFVLSVLYTAFFDPVRVTAQPGIITGYALMVLFTGVLCWYIRTVCLQHLDAVTVAVIMPLSAVVTMAVSILLGMDTLSATTVIGAVIGLIAAVLSEITPDSV